MMVWTFKNIPNADQRRRQTGMEDGEMEMAVQVSTVNNTSLVCDPELSNATKLTLDIYRYYFEVSAAQQQCVMSSLLDRVLTKYKQVKTI